MNNTNTLEIKRLGDVSTTSPFELCPLDQDVKEKDQDQNRKGRAKQTNAEIPNEIMQESLHICEGIETTVYIIRQYRYGLFKL